MKFWCVWTKTLTSQLQVEEATWIKCDVSNHRTTMNYHLILKKYSKVDIVASQHYVHNHD